MNETIVLAETKENVHANDLAQNVPEDKGRYVFYLFKHTFEGDFMESIGKKLPITLSKWRGWVSLHRVSEGV